MASQLKVFANVDVKGRRRQSVRLGMWVSLAQTQFLRFVQGETLCIAHRGFEASKMARRAAVK